MPSGRTFTPVAAAGRCLPQQRHPEQSHHQDHILIVHTDRLAPSPPRRRRRRVRPRCREDHPRPRGDHPRPEHPTPKAAGLTGTTPRVGSGSGLGNGSEPVEYSWTSSPSSTPPPVLGGSRRDGKRRAPANRSPGSTSCCSVMPTSVRPGDRGREVREHRRAEYVRRGVDRGAGGLGQQLRAHPLTSDVGAGFNHTRDRPARSRRSPRVLQVAFITRVCNPEGPLSVHDPTSRQVQQAAG